MRKLNPDDIDPKCGILNPNEIDREVLKLRIGAALEMLRDAAKNPKRWKGEAVEALGIDPRTFDAWLYGEREPEASQLVALIAYFGLDFANAILDLIGLKALGADDNMVPKEKLRQVADRVRALADELDEEAS